MELMLPSYILHKKLLRIIIDIEKKHHVAIVLFKKQMSGISSESTVKMSASCLKKFTTVNFTSNLYTFQCGCMK